MTERLYYTDPYVVEFDARVVRLDEHDGRPAAVLDRTAFYPTSGGQPFDTGRLGTVAVIEVVDREDDGILHVLEGPVETGPIHGSIDWTRRFDHMQQHTGQHVLSAAFDRLLGARTESFHLGSASSTIDLGPVIAAGDVVRAEEEANRVVWEDRPVTIRFVEPDEAARLPLRKEPARTGRLRVIEVHDFDISACGGTHVARTGSIGTIAIVSTEKFRGGTRVEFQCGLRALRGYRTLRDIVASGVRLISALPGELPAGIERLQGEIKHARREIHDLQARLASFEASALVDRAVTHGASRVVIEALEGWDQNGLKTIATAIAQRPGHLAMLFAGAGARDSGAHDSTTGGPHPWAVVIARSAGATADCASLLKQLTARFGGKGGGRADLAQGGGLQGSPADLLDFARTLL
ncbi:MAG: DHHA1 domain-containing protein [Acidobacteriota bacterium]